MRLRRKRREIGDRRKCQKKEEDGDDMGKTDGKTFHGLYEEVNVITVSSSAEIPSFEKFPAVGQGKTGHLSFWAVLGGNHWIV